MSHKIVNEESGIDVIPMSEMKPCDWAEIVECSDPKLNGRIVRRGSSSYDAVDDMTKVGRGSCWTHPPSTIKVRPLKAGHKITIEIT